MEIRPLDFHEMGTVDYDITHYQKVLFAPNRWTHLVDAVGTFFAGSTTTRRRGWRVTTIGAMARSLVRLPPHVRQPFEVYLNGVHQHEGADYRVDGATLVFDRELKKDKISGWRWFLGAWGVGTYRQNE
jgi:hypothetical protein